MERVISVGIKYPNVTYTELENSMEELNRLINTAGGESVINIIQKRERPDPAYFIGKGKCLELSLLCKKEKIRTIIFNEELSYTQQRNLEEIIDSKIIDRTRLILDIFAYRARTKEGMLQVELAQLDYYRTRLTKKGIYLDGQIGGIGTRGPGEKNIEYDRRRIKERMVHLNKEIEKIKQCRKLHREKRKKQNIPSISIIGYTNTGKSTLLNSLIGNLPGKNVYADDKLFATLDPTSRRLILPSSKTVILSDTVGFIRNLPHQLIAAFRATLEEINESDCLLHVIDITSKEHKTQEWKVIKTLEEIGASKIPIIRVYNKIDIHPAKESFFTKYDENTVYISAKTLLGIDKLLKLMDKYLVKKTIYREITLPYEKISIINLIYKYAKIMEKTYKSNCIKMKLHTDEVNWKIIQKKLGDAKNEYS